MVSGFERQTSIGIYRARFVHKRFRGFNPSQQHEVVLDLRVGPPSLLKDPSARVVGFIAGRAEVIESGSDFALLLRSPGEQNVNGLAVFLGQDGDDTAYVGVPVARWRFMVGRLLQGGHRAPGRR